MSKNAIAYSREYNRAGITAAFLRESLRESQLGPTNQERAIACACGTIFVPVRETVPFRQRGWYSGYRSQICESCAIELAWESSLEETVVEADGWYWVFCHSCDAYVRAGYYTQVRHVYTLKSGRKVYAGVGPYTFCPDLEIGHWRY